MFGSAIAVAVFAAQPAHAAATEVVNVQVNPTDAGVEVILETRSGDRPQVFTVNRGNALVADLINTQLDLPGGNGFVQNNPAPGITSVTVSQLDANSVRIVITGEADPPTGQVSSSPSGIVLLANATGTPQAVQPETPDTPPPPPVAQEPQPDFEAPNDSEVLIPDPGITIDGVPVLEPSLEQIAPPTLPAPIPPPIGDIAVSSIDTSPPEVNLGTSEVVPRLVLRDAPVRDVLSLLARAAGLNVAYVGGTGDELVEGGTEGEGTGADVRISLDIENEPVQNVFNYVVRIAGLDVNRVGRTIFVGMQLPNSARQVITRTLRLNQVPVESAVSFLVGLGAETAVTTESVVTTVTATPITTEEGIVAEDAETRQTEQREEVTIDVQRVDYQDSEPILRGLQVVADIRTNSVTLVGNPRAIEIAAAQLAQLDIRRRQAAINVRVIDVNLIGIDRASTSFSFGVDDTRIIQDGGVGIINFGSTGENDSPANSPIAPDSIGNAATLGGGDLPGNFNFIRNFLAQLQFAVTSGNAKILTDPTLVVQEGQIAEVQLTQDVITNFEREIQGTGDNRTETVTVERTPAGLILQIQVDRIDDNGFVSMSVAPAISAPADVQEIDLGDSGSIVLTLLSIRRVSSGQIRVRDGQTLILSGVIQERDRANVTKVPILGDIPILGALFRSTERQNERQEVIVLLTPHIIDDSDTSTFGYRYVPTAETQDYLQEQGIETP
ncbi:MAG: AMIN domain-containing protein [Cyanobacteria bacterium CRU_2_1]|nr:AMIN domain-containing protein [Cyanobacteria bacterium RU_5_0]NJR58937.1 AMIN domain-containing protein [Cyanobacteria bacterium CRU_2_1]